MENDRASILDEAMRALANAETEEDFNHADELWLECYRSEFANLSPNDQICAARFICGALGNRDDWGEIQRLAARGLAILATMPEADKVSEARHHGALLNYLADAKRQVGDLDEAKALYLQATEVDEDAARGAWWSLTRVAVGQRAGLAEYMSYLARAVSAADFYAWDSREFEEKSASLEVPLSAIVNGYQASEEMRTQLLDIWTTFEQEWRKSDPSNSALHRLRTMANKVFKKGSCFIATACCEPSQRQLVVDLVAFRESVLRRSASGRITILAYEAWSPPIARFIAKREFLKKFVRNALVIPAASIARKVLNHKHCG